MKRKVSEKKLSQALLPNNEVLAQITSEGWDALKEEYIRQIPAIIRSYVSLALDYFKNLRVGVVADALESNKTLKKYYEETRWSPYRMAIAVCRGFFKVNKAWREIADKYINNTIVRLILKFENEKVWHLINMYGNDGLNWLDTCINEFKEITGIKSKQKKKIKVEL
ncbi:MAG: hypothetical protein QXI58_06280 [Candidatus Micrarchaeia archaeon]